VIDDVHRLGGWAVAAHPDSPRQNLRWRGQPLGVDGVEWLNVDSEWRSHTASAITATALRSAVRGPEAIASLFRSPPPGLARWDTMQRARPVVGLAAVDAHARLGADDASWGRAASVRFPLVCGIVPDGCAGRRALECALGLTRSRRGGHPGRIAQRALVFNRARVCRSVSLARVQCDDARSRAASAWVDTSRPEWAAR
jgi:hypothetical protein